MESTCNNNNNTSSQKVFEDEKMQNSISSDIQINFSLCPRKDLDNDNNDRRQYKFFKNADREKDQRITEFYTRLYRISFESHVQGCTKEHALLDKDKLDEIINSVISSEYRKKIEETILLHSNLYELIIPEFKCHGLGFYYKPESDHEIFIKNLEACYYESCPMYVKHVDSSCKINYSERWNNVNDEEKEAFALIALCAENVFYFMYPNYKEIQENMKQENLDFNISINFNQRNSKLFNNDEKDKSIFLDRREMNLRSIQRCSKLLDNLTDGSNNKEKSEIHNSNLEQRLQQLLLQPQFNSQESWKKIGKRFVVTSILSLFLVIATTLGFYFLNN